MMNETVGRIVEIMFQDVEMNEETAAIREEVMNNCQERFTDMVASGIGEDEAISAVVESLKGMEDVLAPYKKKAQHARAEEAADLQGGEQHLTFASGEVHRIDAALVKEDVNIEASDDDLYHVIWDANENPLVNVELSGGVLRVTRRPGEDEQTGRSSRHEQHFQMDDMSGFVKTEDGKIEINMDGISRSMRSLGEKLKLMFTEGVKISVGKTWGSVTIQVPENAMPHVKLLTTSGDISVQDAALTELIVTSTSGDINVDLDEERPLERLELRTTSGDLEVRAHTGDASISTTSGDVEAEGRYNRLNIATISGDMDVRANVVNMSFSAISGDVDLSFESDEVSQVKGSTISGDIDIDLPEGIGTMAIQAQTRSGDVTTRCHTNGVGPTVTGGVSSMSGDITIR